MTYGKYVDRFNPMITMRSEPPSRGSRRAARPRVCLSPSQSVSSNEWPCHCLEAHYLGMQTKKGRPHGLRSQAGQSQLESAIPTKQALGTS